MTTAGFLCAFMACIDLVPACESAKVKDRLGMCEPVRRCYSVRAAYCALAERQEREREAEMVRQANRERSEGQ